MLVFTDALKWCALRTTFTYICRGLTIKMIGAGKWYLARNRAHIWFSTAYGSDTNQNWKYMIPYAVYTIIADLANALANWLCREQHDFAKCFSVLHTICGILKPWSTHTVMDNMDEVFKPWGWWFLYPVI